MTIMSKAHISTNKAVSSLLVVSFFLMELAYAAPDLAFSTSSNITAMPVATVAELAQDPSRAEVPFEYSLLREFHTGTAGKLIIHIQDAHSNLSGQENLSHMLDRMIGRYQIPLVLVEGADRDVSLGEARKAAPPDAWKQVARRLLYEGVISGEEYLNLTSDHPMKILGVEYRDLYEKNLKAYAALVDRRKDILLYLHRARISLGRAKNKIYPEKVLAYESKKEAASDGGDANFAGNLESLFAFLGEAKLSVSAEFPEAQKLQAIRGKERAIDFDKANADQSRLMANLAAKGASDELKAFAESSKRTQNLQISQYMVLKDLFDKTRQKGLEPRNYPELYRYFEYLKDFADLKMDVVLEEIQILEEKAYDALLQSDDQKKLRAVNRFIDLLENAYSIKMTSKDFDLFTVNEPDFKTQSWQAFLNQKLAELSYLEDLVPYRPVLEEAKASLEEFYRLVDQRDAAFIENTKRILDEQGQDAAFLITGGYHTQHLTELFRSEGWSYIVLSPVVQSETDQKKYENLLLEPIKLAQQKAEKADQRIAAAPSEDASKAGIRALSLRLARMESARQGAFDKLKSIQGYRPGLDAIDQLAKTTAGANTPQAAGSRAVSPQKLAQAQAQPFDMEQTIRSMENLAKLRPVNFPAKLPPFTVNELNIKQFVEYLESVASTPGTTFSEGALQHLLKTNGEGALFRNAEFFLRMDGLAKRLKDAAIQIGRSNSSNATAFIVKKIGKIVAEIRAFEGVQRAIDFQIDKTGGSAMTNAEKAILVAMALAGSQNPMSPDLIRRLMSKAVEDKQLLRQAFWQYLRRDYDYGKINDEFDKFRFPKFRLSALQMLGLPADSNDLAALDKRRDFIVSEQQVAARRETASKPAAATGDTSRNYLLLGLGQLTVNNRRIILGMAKFKPGIDIGEWVFEVNDSLNDRAQLLEALERYVQRNYPRYDKQGQVAGQISAAVIENSAINNLDISGKPAASPAEIAILHQVADQIRALQKPAKKGVGARATLPQQWEGLTPALAANPRMLDQLERRVKGLADALRENRPAFFIDDYLGLLVKLIGQARVPADSSAAKAYEQDARQTIAAAIATLRDLVQTYSSKFPDQAKLMTQIIENPIQAEDPVSVAAEKQADVWAPRLRIAINEPGLGSLPAEVIKSLQTNREVSMAALANLARSLTEKRFNLGVQWPFLISDAERRRGEMEADAIGGFSNNERELIRSQAGNALMQLIRALPEEFRQELEANPEIQKLFRSKFVDLKIAGSRVNPREIAEKLRENRGAISFKLIKNALNILLNPLPTEEGDVVIANSDKNTLDYVRDVLKSFDVDVSKINPELATGILAELAIDIKRENQQRTVTRKFEAVQKRLELPVLKADAELLTDKELEDAQLQLLKNRGDLDSAIELLPTDVTKRGAAGITANELSARTDQITAQVQKELNARRAISFEQWVSIGSLASVLKGMDPLRIAQDIVVAPIVPGDRGQMIGDLRIFVEAREQYELARVTKERAGSMALFDQQLLLIDKLKEINLQTADAYSSYMEDLSNPEKTKLLKRLSQVIHKGDQLSIDEPKFGILRRWLRWSKTAVVYRVLGLNGDEVIAAPVSKVDDASAQRKFSRKELTAQIRDPKGTVRIATGSRATAFLDIQKLSEDLRGELVTAVQNAIAQNGSPTGFLNYRLNDYKRGQGRLTWVVAQYLRGADVERLIGLVDVKLGRGYGVLGRVRDFFDGSPLQTLRSILLQAHPEAEADTPEDLAKGPRQPARPAAPPAQPSAPRISAGDKLKLEAARKEFGEVLRSRAWTIAKKLGNKPNLSGVARYLARAEGITDENLLNRFVESLRVKRERSDKTFEILPLRNNPKFDRPTAELIFDYEVAKARAAEPEKQGIAKRRAEQRLRTFVPNQPAVLIHLIAKANERAAGVVKLAKGYSVNGIEARIQSDNRIEVNLTNPRAVMVLKGKDGINRPAAVRGFSIPLEKISVSVGEQKPVNFSIKKRFKLADSTIEISSHPDGSLSLQVLDGPLGFAITGRDGTLGAQDTVFPTLKFKIKKPNLADLEDAGVVFLLAGSRASATPQAILGSRTIDPDIVDEKIDVIARYRDTLSDKEKAKRPALTLALIRTALLRVADINERRAAESTAEDPKPPLVLLDVLPTGSFTDNYEVGLDLGTAGIVLPKLQREMSNRWVLKAAGGTMGVDLGVEQSQETFLSADVPNAQAFLQAQRQEPILGVPWILNAEAATENKLNAYILSEYIQFSLIRDYVRPDGRYSSSRAKDVLRKSAELYDRLANRANRIPLDVKTDLPVIDDLSAEPYVMDMGIYSPVADVRSMAHLNRKIKFLTIIVDFAKQTFSEDDAAKFDADLKLVQSEMTPRTEALMSVFEDLFRDADEAKQAHLLQTLGGNLRRLEIQKPLSGVEEASVAQAIDRITPLAGAAAQEELRDSRFRDVFEGRLLRLGNTLLPIALIKDGSYRIVLPQGTSISQNSPAAGFVESNRRIIAIPQSAVLSGLLANLTLGSNASTAIRFAESDASGVSKNHGTLSFTDSGVIYADNQNDKGSFLDGKKVYVREMLFAAPPVLASYKFEAAGIIFEVQAVNGGVIVKTSGETRFRYLLPGGAEVRDAMLYFMPAEKNAEGVIFEALPRGFESIPLDPNKIQIIGVDGEFAGAQFKLAAEQAAQIPAVQSVSPDSRVQIVVSAGAGIFWENPVFVLKGASVKSGSFSKGGLNLVEKTITDGDPRQIYMNAVQSILGSRVTSTLSQYEERFQKASGDTNKIYVLYSLGEVLDKFGQAGGFKLQEVQEIKAADQRLRDAAEGAVLQEMDHYRNVDEAHVLSLSSASIAMARLNDGSFRFILPKEATVNNQTLAPLTDGQVVQIPVDVASSRVLGNIALGRAPFNDIQFSNGDVSSKHGALSIANGVIIYNDLGSSNGSFNEKGREKAWTIFEAQAAVTMVDATLALLSQLPVQIVRATENLRKEIDNTVQSENHLGKVFEFERSLGDYEAAYSPLNADETAALRKFLSRYVSQTELGESAKEELNRLIAALVSKPVFPVQHLRLGTTTMNVSTRNGDLMITLLSSGIDISGLTALLQKDAASLQAGNTVTIPKEAIEGGKILKITIGRREDRAIRIVAVDQESSRDHGEISWSAADGVVYEDTNSKNGSYLNGRRMLPDDQSRMVKVLFPPASGSRSARALIEQIRGIKTDLARMRDSVDLDEGDAGAEQIASAFKSDPRAFTERLMPKLVAGGKQDAQTQLESRYAVARLLNGIIRIYNTLERGLDGKLSLPKSMESDFVEKLLSASQSAGRIGQMAIEAKAAYIGQRSVPELKEAADSNNVWLGLPAFSVDVFILGYAAAAEKMRVLASLAGAQPIGSRAPLVLGKEFFKDPAQFLKDQRFNPDPDTNPADPLEFPTAEQERKLVAAAADGLAENAVKEIAYKTYGEYVDSGRYNFKNLEKAKADFLKDPLNFNIDDYQFYLAPAQVSRTLGPKELEDMLFTTILISIDEMNAVAMMIGDYNLKKLEPGTADDSLIQSFHPYLGPYGREPYDVRWKEIDGKYVPVFREAGQLIGDESRASIAKMFATVTGTGEEGESSPLSSASPLLATASGSRGAIPDVSSIRPDDVEKVKILGTRGPESALSVKLKNAADDFLNQWEDVFVKNRINFWTSEDRERKRIKNMTLGRTIDILDPRVDEVKPSPGLIYLIDERYMIRVSNNAAKARKLIGSFSVLQEELNAFAAEKLGLTGWISTYGEDHFPYIDTLRNYLRQQAYIRGLADPADLKITSDEKALWGSGATAAAKTEPESGKAVFTENPEAKNGAEILHDRIQDFLLVKFPDLLLEVELAYADRRNSNFSGNLKMLDSMMDVFFRQAGIGQYDKQSEEYVKFLESVNTYLKRMTGSAGARGAMLAEGRRLPANRVALNALQPEQITALRQMATKGLRIQRGNDYDLAVNPSDFILLNVGEAGVLSVDGQVIERLAEPALVAPAAPVSIPAMRPTVNEGPLRTAASDSMKGLVSRMASADSFKLMARKFVEFAEQSSPATVEIIYQKKVVAAYGDDFDDAVKNFRRTIGNLTANVTAVDTLPTKAELKDGIQYVFIVDREDFMNKVVAVPEGQGVMTVGKAEQGRSFNLSMANMLAIRFGTTDVAASTSTALDFTEDNHLLIRALIGTLPIWAAQMLDKYDGSERANTEIPNYFLQPNMLIEEAVAQSRLLAETILSAA